MWKYIGLWQFWVTYLGTALVISAIFGSTVFGIVMGFIVYSILNHHYKWEPAADAPYTKRTAWAILLFGLISIPSAIFTMGTFWAYLATINAVYFTWKGFIILKEKDYV